MSTKRLAYRGGWALLASSGLGLLLYSYNAKLCFLDRERPIFGDYTIRCLWNGHIEELDVHRLGTREEPRLDPVSRYIVTRMARKIAAQETSRAGPLRTYADIDVRVYGRFLPCDVDVRAMEFSNPNVLNPKPRFLYEPPKRSPLSSEN
jgi:hypothetical protein